MGLLRGVLQTDDGTEVFLRSPSLAKRVADDLAALEAGSAIDEHAVARESQIPRYAAARSADSKGRTLIFATEGTPRDPGRFGAGIIGAAADPAWAKRIAELLNRVDPAARRRNTRSVGWW